MTIRLVELADEVRILELEARKRELENLITHLKSEQLIDDDCVGCAGPCMVVDVAAELQEELDDYKKTIQLERIDRAAEKDVINRKYSEDLRKKNVTIKELKDRNIEDLHELYDLSEKELNQVKSDSVIMLTNCHNVVAKLREDNRGLEVELGVANLELRDYGDFKRSYALLTAKLSANNTELSARKEDSEVLMKIVEIVKRDDNCPTIINQLADLLVDYLDAPEGPPETPIDDLYKVSIFLEMP